jgi:Domain of unknown function (DUF4124)
VRCLQFVTALAILLVAQPFAHAAIYVWHDPQGVTHYVDNLDNVPSEYRGGATLLVKDWERPALPPEPAAPAADASAVASAATVDQVAASSFERGLWAGRESAMASLPAPPDVSLGPIVQNVQVFAPPEAPVIYGYPLFGPVFFPRFHSRRGLAPRAHGRFIVGPGGPPPLGAAGPSPFGAAGPAPVFFFRR